MVRLAVELPVRQESLRIAVDVMPCPMRLAGVVPLVYAIDDRLMGSYLRHARRDGKEIFCRDGCSACCKEYLVVFSPAELYYQMEKLASGPQEPRRRALEWMARVEEAARACGLVERLQGLSKDDKPLDIIEAWWRGRDERSCPFLAGGSCGIYPHRFVACREFYSHAPPECCARHATARMPVPLHLVNTLWRLEERLTGEPCGAFSLPFMRFWAHLRREAARRTWPAVEMVEQLFQVLSWEAGQAQQLSAGASVDRA